MAMHCTSEFSGQLHYLPYTWVRLLNQKLVDLAARRIRFLIVEAPVRHGKSELGSKWFPAWYLGQFPNHRIILAGHSVDFARTFGRAVRGIVGQYGPPLFNIAVASGREERDDFGARILGRSYAADDWTLAYPHNGGMASVGKGNPPTGKGGNLISLDDPIKSSEEAYSATYRESLWQWWQFDIRTRLEPGGVIVLIMSRWHEDDLTGRLLRQQEQGAYDGDTAIDHWEVLHLPALADHELVDPDPLGRADGEALCPERYDRTELLKRRHASGAIAFDALYQNSPRPPEGTLFKRSDWRYASGVKAGLRWYRWWDMAATEKSVMSSDPDWTAGVLIAKDDNGYTWIADVRRTREEADGVEQYIRNTAIVDIDRYGCREVRIPKDPGQAGKALGKHYGRRILGDVAVRMRAEAQSGDKYTRALPYAGQQALGNVILVRGPWNEEFVEEHAAFPRGAHDDMVDATAMGYMDVAGLLHGETRIVV